MRICNSDFLLLLGLMGVLPHVTGEIFKDQKELVEFRRLQGGKDSAIINELHISDLVEFSRNEVIIILCLPGQIKRAQAASVGAMIPPLIISTVDKLGVVNAKRLMPLSCSSIDELLLEKINLLLKKHNSSLNLPPIRQRYEVDAPIQSRSHGVTLANEVVLLSLGFSFSSAVNISSADDKNYADAIRDSSEAILDAVSPDGEGRDLIIYAPSILAGLWDFKQNFWNQLLRTVKNKFLKEFVKNGLFRNKAYSGVRFASQEFSNPYEDPVVGPIFLMRQQELSLVSHGIAQLAASSSVPAIRLPNAVNFHLADLKELELLINSGDEKSNTKIQELFKKIQHQLAAEIPADLLDIIRDRGEQCTLVADAPIEWLPIDGIPLMIRNDVSRIPMTPGNMFLQLMMLGDFPRFKSESLKDILVVRSFAEDDPIRDMLETAINRYPIAHGVKTTVVDVESIAELIDALNNHAGMIVVFDCHGAHGGKDDTGWLVIGKEKLDTWSLAHKARVPPIVLLSACLTSPTTGSHASVANGFVRSGAIAVVSTFMSVNAISSAILVARLIFRIDSFLPALKSLGFKLITWKQLVSTFFKMSYATDVLRYFDLSQSGYQKIHMDANMDINGLNPLWHDNLLENISKETGVEVNGVKDALENLTPFTDTLMYCQIGRPELIEILLD